MKADTKLRKELFVETLLEWYKINKRCFPWRKESDPYRILISELMLQRTQARQVEPVYLEFVKHFPNASTLVNSSIKEIESVIYPLGLAHRATRIRRMAEQLRDKHFGVVPDDIKGLIDLKGVGPYVANAVLSFGFGQDVAVVDANVARVIIRVFTFSARSSRPHTDRTLWSFYQEMLPSGRGPDLNRAIIDFAAAICVARKPLHCQCPIRDYCDYYADHGNDCLVVQTE